MNSAPEFADDLHARAERESRGRSQYWLWPVLIAAGILVYELTAQPGLGAAVACAKFGWDDFLTAFWLRKRDPDRARSWTCFWLYFASGLWKVATAGIVAMFSIGFLVVLLTEKQWPERTFVLLVYTYLVGIVGFGLAGLHRSSAFFQLMGREQESGSMDWCILIAVPNGGRRLRTGRHLVTSLRHS